MRTPSFSSILTTLLAAVASLLPLPSQAAAAATDGSAVVARVDGEPLILQNLEERLAGELRRLENQRYQLLEQGLTRLIEERLLAAEAARRGVSPEELLATEVEGKVEPVTDSQVDTFYSENQARLRRPKAEISDQIRAYLTQQRAQARRQELVAGLRARHRVEVLLEPPRVELDLTGAPSRGPADAPVTLVEFSDFQCPFCSRLNPTLEKVKEAYGEKVRLVFRQFPLTSLHAQAQKAAEASLCARAQGEFWAMHDALFADQDDLEVEALKAKAARLGLDSGDFARCLDNGATRGEVEADVEAGQAAGVSGTPTLFINGRQVTLVRGEEPFDQLARVIDAELARTGS